MAGRVPVMIKAATLHKLCDVSGTKPVWLSKGL